MKKLIFFFSIMVLVGCQEPLLELQDLDVPGISETWKITLVFQDHYFELESYEVKYLVGSSDPLNPSAGNPVIGRSLFFKDAVRKFSCQIVWEFGNQEKNWGYGKFQGYEYLLDGLPSNPQMNFCGGSQDVSATCKIVQLK